jgi:hypothetical protein
MSRHTRHGHHAPPNAAARPSRPAGPTGAGAERPSSPALVAAEPPPSPIETRPAPVVTAPPEPVIAGPVPDRAPGTDRAQGSAAPGAAEPDDEAPRPTCTQAQLRRFIKSRPWIPMHELRRRFGIFGGDDDVTPVRVGGSTIFVGLPSVEGRLLGELLAGGDVGYELSLDPGAPIVVGVYPMRPVPRS